MIWDKVIHSLPGRDTPWARQHEYITFGVYANAAQRGQNDGERIGRLKRGTVLRYARPSGSAVVNHATEKPVMLLRELVEASSRFDEIVLDPFAGSASTLIAAAKEGRRSIGIELDPANVERAVKRLRSEL